MTDRLGELSDIGVSIWLDDLDRNRLTSGGLVELIDGSHVVGVTTNPAIFDHSITTGAADYAEQIRAFVPKGRSYKVLGTDGFGRSDFRSKLREHFEVNRHYIVVAALKALADAEKRLRALRAEVARFQRVCDEALPREVIPCPNCGRNHVENARHDNPLIDGRKRPHHTHRCYHCGHIWDSGRWSFGVEPAAMAVPAVYDPKHYPEGAKAADAALLWQALREKGAQVCENQAGMLDAVGDHNGARAVRLCASVLRSLNPIVAA